MEQGQKTGHPDTSPDTPRSHSAPPGADRARKVRDSHKEDIPVSSVDFVFTTGSDSTPKGGDASRHIGSL